MAPKASAASMYALTGSAIASGAYSLTSATSGAPFSAYHAAISAGSSGVLANACSMTIHVLQNSSP